MLNDDGRLGKHLLPLTANADDRTTSTGPRPRRHRARPGDDRDPLVHLSTFPGFRRVSIPSPMTPGYCKEHVALDIALMYTPFVVVTAVWDLPRAFLYMWNQVTDYARARARDAKLV